MTPLDLVLNLSSIKQGVVRLEEEKPGSTLGKVVLFL
jgi:hypothetical protein